MEHLKAGGRKLETRDQQSSAQLSFSRKHLLAQRIADLGSEVPLELINDLPNELIMKASLDNSFISPDKKAEEVSFLQKELAGEFFKEKQHQLRQRIIQLEEMGNEAGLQDALREFDELNKKFHNT